MSTANRTVVGDDSTSPEAQDYIHNFPITFSALTYASQCQIPRQHSFKELRKENLHLLRRDDFEHENVPGKLCAKLALFGCEAFKAAIDDLGARHVMTFARDEAEALRELTEEEDEKNEGIVALKGNVDWMVELVTLWIEAAN